MTESLAGLVRQHYEAGPDGVGLVAKVAAFLDSLGEDAAQASQLAGLDQFHVGGLPATMELAAFAGVRHGSDVLDAGSGLGGPSRYLADAYGCTVAGVDLAPSYVAIAQLLAERTGLGGRVAYRVGDLAELPFGDGCFDLVWTQHVVMNVRDRKEVYREFKRVLRPGGRVAFYDVLAGDGHPDVVFPVPWAERAGTSFLLTEAETAAAFRQAGFEPGGWKDVTAAAVAGFGQPRPPVPPGPSLAAVMGPRFAGMAANLARNLREGRVRLVMGVA